MFLVYHNSNIQECFHFMFSILPQKYCVAPKISSSWESFKERYLKRDVNKKEMTFWRSPPQQGPSPSSRHISEDTRSTTSKNQVIQNSVFSHKNKGLNYLFKNSNGELELPSRPLPLPTQTPNGLGQHEELVHYCQEARRRLRCSRWWCCQSTNQVGHWQQRGNNNQSAFLKGLQDLKFLDFSGGRIRDQRQRRLRRQCDVPLPRHQV